jgi:hypothetical protein
MHVTYNFQSGLIFHQSNFKHLLTLRTPPDQRLNSTAWQTIRNSQLHLHNPTHSCPSKNGRPPPGSQPPRQADAIPPTANPNATPNHPSHLNPLQLLLLRRTNRHPNTPPSCVLHTTHNQNGNSHTRQETLGLRRHFGQT